MEYLICFLLIFVFACDVANIITNAPPKFLLGDKVVFEVPVFYSKVCNGKGTIQSFSRVERTYSILTHGGCPVNFVIEENKIKLDL